MNKYILIILVFLAASCAEKDKKNKFIYWKSSSESKLRVKFKMETNSDGLIDGYCWHYYKNGQLLSKTRYEEGNLMEIYEVYDSLGNKLNYGYLNNGNGYVISYDDKKGVRNFSGRYENGLRTGWWRNYDFRGELRDSVFFKDGVGDGFDFYLYVLY